MQYVCLILCNVHLGVHAETVALLPSTTLANVTAARNWMVVKTPCAATLFFKTFQMEQFLSALRSMVVLMGSVLRNGAFAWLPKG